MKEYYTLIARVDFRMGDTKPSVFIFNGVQEGYGFFPDMPLYTNLKSQMTYSLDSLDSYIMQNPREWQ